MNLSINKVPDDDTHRALLRIIDAINTLGSVEILKGTLVKDITVGTTETLVPHKLGRKPLGFIVVSADGSGHVYGDTFSTSYLTLTATTSVVVSLWVF